MGEETYRLRILRNQQNNQFTNVKTISMMEKQFNIFDALGTYFEPVNPHYDTINRTRQEKKDDKETGDNQAKAVIRIMQRHPSQYLQAYVVHEMTKADPSLPNWDLNGIRRTITNLQQRGILLKTLTSHLDGGRGKNVHGWMLNPNRPSK